ncbi:hypothetical protein EXU85_06450 [Spirosoma sp. KCTC 42546]|uniref:hypothetical protein n=1 Tax=Spirosoma sp. KCTC 42546 TaxID=2520506 RepID=UPI0011583D84|nr:hypothetical protein [Spirosoma sp. KCTC 42546]QDK78256.1 hypothetical protein EXU85_06450 [Spirosoma sp. KCTC 42546]
MQITIEVEDSVVESLGYERVKDLLSDSATHLEMKVAALEILKELTENDPVQDPDWKAAREQAWEQEKHKYLRTPNP